MVFYRQAFCLLRPFVEFWGYTHSPEFPNMGNQFYRFFKRGNVGSLVAGCPLAFNAG